ncbi:GPI mannosyltransferase 2 [Escovopsis weberi]|uniref:GPI mannosyltransferase 2 n=1 Tax=Escovopsis weberi TaxID=150374 RepID=A0A0M8MZU8_ESCWE|nr:GPI mannosyltransferase 2 [Escovopsis weberi]
MASLLSHESNPLSSLTAVFLGWKSFLLALSLGTAIGSDYDTSTSLFFEHTYGNASVPVLAARLTRWDALYFAYASREGYVYEQQWAFGAAMPTIVRHTLRTLRSLGLGVDVDVDGGVATEPLMAILFANLSHLLAVLVLHRLAVVLFGDRRLAFLASVLHVLSPAGLFLSAPYSESPFAFLSFLGYLLFAEGSRNGPASVRRSLALVGAGVAFGLSTTFRSNGLLNGILFAVEALRCVREFVQRPGFGALLAGIAPVVGGLCVAAGSVVPQAVAWMRYCNADAADVAPRPWCHRTLPSIYTFVQEEYWNCGFLRYWTPSQIPLFVLAGPMLAILISSSRAFLSPEHRAPVPQVSRDGGDLSMLVRTMSGVQFLVAVLAITNFHVQIITRISSGYPLWYCWVAGLLGDEKLTARGSAIVVFMVMYASVQGGLFASFLPPA